MFKLLIERIRNFISFIKPVPFTSDYYSAREIYRPDYNIVANCILSRIQFNTVMDIGCANGFLLESFKKANKNIKGIELSPEVVAHLPDGIRSNIDIGDFSEASGKYDLVSCIEVAEHIEPSESVRLVKKITSIALNTVYFTAAPPGQPGHGHINCRPHSDWIDMFQLEGWSLNEKLTMQIREDISTIKSAVWLIENTLIFNRSNI